MFCAFLLTGKKAGSRQDAAGSIQAAAFRQLANSIRRRAFQPAKSGYSFSCQLISILLLYRAQCLLTARLISPGASRQTSRAAVQLFLQNKSQPPGIQQHSFFSSSNLFPVFPQPPTKKTEPSAQFFPLYISSTFTGLYNTQFSSCNTKPKCLRMPAKSGSLLLSSVITGLSFSSHSRLNSISLLPRPL